MRQNEFHRNKKGFTLLLSVLIASVLLSLGLAIFSITIRELLLSSTGRESQFAFYAADTGIECALYFDLVRGAFSTSTASAVSCNADGSNPTNANQAVGGQGWDVPNTFTISFLPNPYCAVVTVTKTNTGGVVKTDINSRGYNVGVKNGLACESTEPRRLERAIHVIY